LKRLTSAYTRKNKAASLPLRNFTFPVKQALFGVKLIYPMPVMCLKQVLMDRSAYQVLLQYEAYYLLHVETPRLQGVGEGIDNLVYK